MTNPIATENNQSGTSNWRISSIASTQIQIYADKLSCNPGDTINFYVSVQTGGTTYTLNIYRLGSYLNNPGGNLKSTVSGRTGVAQGYWDEAGLVLTNDTTAVIDSTTHRIEAGWTSTDSWAVPANACTGVYMAQATDANNFQTCCTFVVKGNATADYVYIRSDFTDYAYNYWGGYSLYESPAHLANPNATNTPATKVSFDRPNNQFGGSGGLLGHEMAAIRWLEGQGYNLSYLSQVDVSTNPAQLLNYKAILLVGHTEYWTKEMRDGIEAAILAGVGLGNFAANTCYWQVRLEADSTSVANRTLTCYKVQSNGQTNVGPRSSISALSNDPFYGVDNTRVTTIWRDPLLNRPESAILGPVYTEGNHYAAFETDNIAWIVDSNAGSNSLLAGTGLVAGQSYGIDGVGYEWDGGTSSTSPSNLQIIGTTPTTNISNQASTSNSTFYIHPSGARIFSAGAINWTNMLDTYRWFTPTQSGNRVAPEVQRFMMRVMDQLIVGKNPKSFSVFSALHA